MKMDLVEQVVKASVLLDGKSQSSTPLLECMSVTKYLRCLSVRADFISFKSFNVPVIKEIKLTVNAHFCVVGIISILIKVDMEEHF